MNPKFLVMNIYYDYSTFCIACRHRSYLFDTHPWCMVCMLLAGYWPCTGSPGSAVCVRCAGYEDATRERCEQSWMKLYNKATGVLASVPTALLKTRDRLPVTAATQFDASLSTILRDQLRDHVSWGYAGDLTKALKRGYRTKKYKSKKKADDKPPRQPGAAASTGKPPRMSPRNKKKTNQPPLDGHEEGEVEDDDEDTDEETTDDEEDEALQKAKEESLITARAARQRARRGGKFPGPSRPLPDASHSQTSPGPSPPKRSRGDNDGAGDVLEEVAPPPTMEDYLNLAVPWNQIALALMGQAGFKQISYPDGESGLLPADEHQPHMTNKLQDIWHGFQIIRCRRDVEGPWLIMYSYRGKPHALSPPTLPCPTPETLKRHMETAKPITYSIVESAPLRFKELYNPRTVQWPEFVNAHLSQNYKPLLKHLCRRGRWRALLPADHEDPGVDQVTDVSTYAPLLPALTFVQTWEKLSTMTAPQLLDIYKQHFKPGEKIYVLAHTQGWWRKCAATTFSNYALTPQQFLAEPLLLPTDDPDDETVPALERRPANHTPAGLTRPAPQFTGITPTAIDFLKARAAEQCKFLVETPQLPVLSHTFRSQRMRLYTQPYMAAQDDEFPLRTLRIPDAVAWGDRLSSPLDWNLAYPLPDVSLRYSESLQRADDVPAVAQGAALGNAGSRFSTADQHHFGDVPRLCRSCSPAGHGCPVATVVSIERRLRDSH